jgi:hypothetical protein
MENQGQDNATRVRVAVDAHVHFHACFDADLFLSHALFNIRSRALFLGRVPEEALLLVAEMRSGPNFSDLVEAVVHSSNSNHEVVAENHALRIDTGTPPRLVVIPGRQIQTSEKLEILTVGVVADPPDGETFGESLERVVAEKSVAILPWAFGKWAGARGKLILDAMSRYPVGTIHLGDSGARCAGTPLPNVLARAQELGFTDVRGSDPLPFRNAVRRIGSYGFYLDGPIDQHDPLAWFQDQLRELRSPVETFGSRTSPAAFALQQTLLQLSSILRKW